MQDIVRHYVMRYTLVGAKDVGGNDVHVFVGSGTILDDNSPLWDTSEPMHGSKDCVTAYGWDDPATLKSYVCSTERPCYICEVY